MTAGTGNGLYNRQIHCLQKVYRPAFSNRATVYSNSPHAVAECAHQTIHTWLPLLIQNELLQNRWRAASHAQAVAEDRQYITVLTLDHLDKRIDEFAVPAHIVCTVKQHTDGWPPYIPALLQIVLKRHMLWKSRMVDAVFRE